MISAVVVVVVSVVVSGISSKVVVVITVSSVFFVFGVLVFCGVRVTISDLACEIVVVVME